MAQPVSPLRDGERADVDLAPIVSPRRWTLLFIRSLYTCSRFAGGWRKRSIQPPARKLMASVPQSIKCSTIAIVCNDKPPFPDSIVKCTVESLTIAKASAALNGLS